MHDHYMYKPQKAFYIWPKRIVKAEVAELGKGARLRALFRRDPWVQIPSSAPDAMVFGEQSSNIASLTMGISGLNATSGHTCNPFLRGLLSIERNMDGNMISALDDILEDFEVYLRVENRLPEGVTRNYCYSVGKFLRWLDTLDPEKKDALKYYDSMTESEQ